MYYKFRYNTLFPYIFVIHNIHTSGTVVIMSFICTDGILPKSVAELRGFIGYFFSTA